MADSNASSQVGGQADSGPLPKIVEKSADGNPEEVKVCEKPSKKQRQRGKKHKPITENEALKETSKDKNRLADGGDTRKSESDQAAVNTRTRQQLMSEGNSVPASQAELKTKIKRIKGKLAKYSLQSNRTRKQSEPVSASDPVENGHPAKRKQRSYSERSVDCKNLPSVRLISFSATSQSESTARSLSESQPGNSRDLSGKNDEGSKTGKKKFAIKKKEAKEERVRGEKSSMEKTYIQYGGHLTVKRRGDIIYDSLSFFLLDLLLLPAEKRETLIAREARSRGLLLEDDNSWYLNPKIVAWRDGPFRQAYNNIPETLKTLDGKAFTTTFDEERLLPRTFEDFANVVVHEGLQEDQRKDFTMPKTKKSERTKNYFKTPSFEENLEAFAQKCVDAKLGVIVEEEVRVSSKNNDHAFIKVPDSERDAMFSSQLLRKYALHGDVVRAFVRNVVEDPAGESDKPDLQPDVVLDGDSSHCLDTSMEVAEEEPLLVCKSAKAFVIKVVKEVHNKLAVGTFMSCRKNSPFITFVPRDMRLPNIRIYEEHWPESFKAGKLENISDTLYVAEIIDWCNEVAVGRIVQPIGKCGDLDSENQAILLSNNLKFVPFDEKFNQIYSGEFTITDEELKRREDLRDECIFTIDPLTAKDLDDAMSVKQLDDGNFEVGVHISDVAYFLDEESELDQLVKKRTTSVYMVNEVFHMLPKSLCFRCSLLPDADKLAFSVLWTMTPQAEVLSTRFARTVIRSCTQLAYQHAQMIIDNPDREFGEMDFPQIHNGFKPADIVRRVKQLDSLASVLRDKRFANGSLRIDRPKIYFDLDPNTGAPIAFRPQEQLPANFLIEEFMLLANQSVAAFIYEKFPSISILRKHQAPVKNVLKRTKDQLQKSGLTLDVSSAKSIYNSLTRLVREMGNSKVASVCLSQLISKPMVRAKYFCSDDVSPEEFKHYALAIPIYTHFTSPIRRYPDVLVHRVLAAALNYVPAPKRNPAELKSLAESCNDDKYNAKLAGEDSTNLYFLHYVQSKKSVVMLASLVSVYSHSFEAILVETSATISVNLRTCDNVKVRISKENGVCRLYAIYPNSEDKEIELTLCSEVWLQLSVKSKKLRGKLVPPPSANQQNTDAVSMDVSEVAKEEESNSQITESKDNTETLAKIADENLTIVPSESPSAPNDQTRHPLCGPNSKTRFSSENISELVKSQSIALARLLGAKTNVLDDDELSSSTAGIIEPRPLPPQSEAASLSRSGSVSSESTSVVSTTSSNKDDEVLNADAEESLHSASVSDDDNIAIGNIEKNAGAASLRIENTVVVIAKSMEQISVAETHECAPEKSIEQVEDNNQSAILQMSMDDAQGLEDSDVNCQKQSVDLPKPGTVEATTNS